MAGNLTDTPQWQAVPYFESGAVLTGGPDCPDNIPIQVLANRAAYLKAQIESALGGKAGMPGHLLASDPHPQYVKLTALLAELSTLLSASPPALTANGAEIISALWARSQLPSAGRNSEGIRVRRILAANTDPFAIVEDFDGDFDGTLSPNMPSGFTGFVRLQVSRHSVTTYSTAPSPAIAVPGAHLYAEYVMTSLTSNMRAECRAMTDPLTSVVSHTPWLITASSTTGSLRASVTFAGGNVVHLLGFSSAVNTGNGFFQAVFATAAPHVNYAVCVDAAYAAIHGIEVVSKSTAGIGVNFINQFNLYSNPTRLTIAVFW